MRNDNLKTLLRVLFLSLVAACNSDNSGDGGADATTEPPVDLCAAFTSAGESCPHVSTRNCFPICEASDPGGCKCVASDAGPIWECSTGGCSIGCLNSSPLCDAGDGGDGSGPEASTDASDDTADDVSDAGALLDAADGE